MDLARISTHWIVAKLRHNVPPSLPPNPFLHWLPGDCGPECRERGRGPWHARASSSLERAHRGCHQYDPRMFVSARARKGQWRILIGIAAAATDAAAAAAAFFSMLSFFCFKISRSAFSRYSGVYLRQGRAHFPHQTRAEPDGRRRRYGYDGQQGRGSDPPKISRHYHVSSRRTPRGAQGQCCWAECGLCEHFAASAVCSREYRAPSFLCYDCNYSSARSADLLPSAQ